MKVLEFATFLVSVAAAEGVEADVRQDSWKTCMEDSDCLEEHSCVKLMWKDDEGQFSSEQGCKYDSHCSGTATWDEGGGDLV